MISGDAFYELAIVLSIAAVVGAIGLKLRQPLIVSFLVAGIMVGPSGLRIIENYEKIDLLAQIGISLLLFVVGLRLDFHMIRTIGPVALATGLGQVIFTLAIGFLIAVSLGMPVVSAAYVATALTFSSTIIIVKLLSDKKEIDSLHGRIAVGFLIVQDIIAILSLIILTGLGWGLGGSGSHALKTFVMISRGLIFLVGIVLLMRYVLPLFLKYLAKSQEILVLFSITWAVLLAATGSMLGFSKEVGAFLAGISLATTGYREAIGARLVTLRDFLLLFFFINLGSRLQINILETQLLPAAIFSVFVLIGNPLIVMAIMGFMGYRKRTGFMAGLTVAQISEFSLILAALGVSLGHLNMQAMGLITIVGMITICVSTYMILYSAKLYNFFSPRLGIFERKSAHRETGRESSATKTEADIILIGLGNYGSEIAVNLIERRRQILAVDFDPQALSRWNKAGLEVVYGDIGDPEFIEQLPVNHAKWIVSTIRDIDLSLILLKILTDCHFKGKIAMSALDEKEARKLIKAGADIVLRPFQDAAEYAADAFTEAANLQTIEEDWPIAMNEIRLKTGSVFAGRALSEIPLRAQTGVSVLALSRAGKVYFELTPDFTIYPNDRIVMMGTIEQLLQAQQFIEQRQPADDEQKHSGFAMAGIGIAENSINCGRTLSELRFRQDYGVTVVGIQRGEEKIISPKADEIINRGDRLIVVGSKKSIERLKSLSCL
ncbi:MAG: cation:proton antiporter [Phycisphaerae bacterium]|nr:cation:proton antiporter [Phycisphaerae bacterium]